MTHNTKLFFYNQLYSIWKLPLQVTSIHTENLITNSTNDQMIQSIVIPPIFYNTHFKTLERIPNRRDEDYFYSYKNAEYWHYLYYRIRLKNRFWLSNDMNFINEIGEKKHPSYFCYIADTSRLKNVRNYYWLNSL